MKRGTARIAGGCLVLGGVIMGSSSAATYTTPRQLNLGDTYQLNPDSATGDEDTTCPKTDANTGTGGDNPYYQRTNVARAHLGGCTGRYWYTSNYQMLCTDVPPVNTCGAGPCIDEPDVNGPQYVDYIPPFGPGTNELTPGRYQITGEYRNTTSRAPYPAEYIVHHANGTTTVLKSQLDGVSGSCPSFVIGTFDLNTGSSVRVNDTGDSSITFNQMKFTLVGPLGGIPAVSAGSDQTIALPSTASLSGFANDDGQPGPLTVTWSKVSGPGTVIFGDANSVTTTAEFSAAGTYVLRLTASDTLNTVSDDVTITVLAQGATLTYSTQYEFDADPSTAAGVIDADPLDVNGSGVLTRVGNGYGAAGAGAGIANGILRFIDNSASSGNFGWYFQNNGNPISLTADMRVKVNAGVTGSTGRRSMGFSSGPRNLGLRLHQPDESQAGSVCTTGSLRFVASTGGTGAEGCANTTDWRRLRVTVDTASNLFRVYDLDAQIEVTNASGSSGTQSWAAEIDNKGGFHIGSISNSNTTLTDFELDYCRVLLGLAVESPTTAILEIGQCNATVFADVEPAPDGDGDVDLNDFAVFQSCYTGLSEGVLDGTCRCFDRNSDNRINEFDFSLFEDCANTSRAGVAADPLCDGP